MSHSEDNLRVAVLGHGAWGRNLVRNFAGLGVLDTVCDPRSEARGECRRAYSSVRVAESADGVFADAGLAAVVIATPAETHGELVRAALAAGKDVFVEKPLCLAVKEGEELVRRAAEAGRILMVGHVLEYHPAVTSLLQMVQCGVLGNVHYVYSNRLSLGKVRKEENILWSFAPHDIAIVLRLMGELPCEVVACGGSYLQPQVADMTVTHLLFRSGARAHIFVSWLHPFKEQRLVVIGDRKMASFDDVNKRVTLHDQRVDWHEGLPVPVRGEGEPVSFASEEPLARECAAFLTAVRTRKPPLTDGPSALRVLRVLDAAQRSLASGGAPVTLLSE